MSPENAREVYDLGLAGIGFVKESRRFYPKKELAGQLLGFVDLDGKGLEGLERTFDFVLRGQGGRVITEIDAKRRRLPVLEQVIERRTAGRDLVLTLDHVIQHIVERELSRAVKSERAKSGVVVVFDPRLGDVLAMATAPGFDPNRFRKSAAADWRNRALSDTFEPGSTMKPFAVAGCLEEKRCNPETVIDCGMGSFRIGGHTFTDHHRYGYLSVADVLKHSSNIGAMKIALRLGRQRLYQTLGAFGFGKKLTALSQEAAGRLPPPEKWSKTTIAAVAMGYEMMATPLQLAAAYGAIANGGLLLRPRFVLSPSHLEPSEVLGRVLSTKNARALRKMLQRVVEGGTGKAGRIQGLTAAGKTGTAKKLDPRTGKYSPTAVRATFVGMIPAEDPEIVIVVTLDEPKKNPWGGLAAAPVFRAIGRQTMGYLRTSRPVVPPDGLLPDPKPRDSSKGPNGDKPRPRDLGHPRRPRAVESPADLVGLSMRRALREAQNRGWSLRVSGSGYAAAVHLDAQSDREHPIWNVAFKPGLIGVTKGGR